MNADEKKSPVEMRSIHRAFLEDSYVILLEKRKVTVMQVFIEPSLLIQDGIIQFTVNDPVRRKLQEIDKQIEEYKKLYYPDLIQLLKWR